MLASESPPPAEDATQPTGTCYGAYCNDSANIQVNDSSLFNISLRQSELACIFETSPEDFMTSTFFQICVFVMYSAVFVVALVGNGLVCFVVQTSPRMKTVTNYFIVNLAVGDILMTLFCVPFSFVSMLVLRYWPFGALMCKVVNYSQAVSVLVSAYTLLAISIDRYMAIMRPLQPRLGKTAARLVVTAVWGGALATAAPIPIVSQLQRPSFWHEACEVDICGEIWANTEQSKQYTSALLALQFALPLSALICTYARIGYVVWGGRPPGEAQSARDSRMQHSKRKMIKMMVTVVAVFTICWLPLNIFIFLWTTHEADESWGAWPGMPYVWFASHWLAMSHSCYNPIIYCYMNARYRRGFKQILSRLVCQKPSDTGRSCPRSSICEGIPLSVHFTIQRPRRFYSNGKHHEETSRTKNSTEMVGVNGSTVHRPTIVGCKCESRAPCGVLNNVTKCSTCTALRHLKLMPAAVARGTSSAPARALSVGSDFRA